MPLSTVSGGCHGDELGEATKPADARNTDDGDEKTTGGGEGGGGKGEDRRGGEDDNNNSDAKMTGQCASPSFANFRPSRPIRCRETLIA